MLKQDIKQYLHTAVCEIIFTKKDGTERALVGTTKSDLLEKDESVKTPKVIAENDNNVRVFDLEKQGWRSFNIDTIKSFKVLGETYEKN